MGIAFTLAPFTVFWAPTIGMTTLAVVGGVASALNNDEHREHPITNVCNELSRNISSDLSGFQQQYGQPSTYTGFQQQYIQQKPDQSIFQQQYGQQKPNLSGLQQQYCQPSVLSGFQQQYGQPSVLSGFQQQYGQPSVLSGFQQQYGQPSVLPGFQQQYGQQKPDQSGFQQQQLHVQQSIKNKITSNIITIKNNYDTNVAATIFNEARGESKEGRQAVAAVISNRIDYSCPKCNQNHGLSDWAKTSVFNGYQSSKPNVPKEEVGIWNECVKFAQDVKNGSISDNTNGATHFKTTKFGQGYQDKGRRGQHYFAREITETTRHQK